MSSASQILPEVSLSCHLQVICTLSARCPHEISTGNIFPLKEQTALLKTQDPPAHHPTPTPTKQQVLSETEGNELSKEDKRFLRMEQRLELKMKESVKEGIKESMQEVVDNTLTAAMSKMTDAVNELIKTNHSVVTQQTTLHTSEHENKALNYQVQKLEYKQDKLKNKLDVIENKGLESCVIIRGITKSISEDTSSLMENVYKELSKTIDARSEWE